MSKEKTYVVTQAWLGPHAQGSLVSTADLPGDAATHEADGAIREATADEIAAGRAEVIDPATVKQFAAVSKLQDAAREANPQKQGVSMLPSEPEAPRSRKPAAPPAAPVTEPAAPAKEPKSNG